jgi:hypothetical protein
MSGGCGVACRYRGRMSRPCVQVAGLCTLRIGVSRSVSTAACSLLSNLSGDLERDTSSLMGRACHRSGHVSVSTCIINHHFHYKNHLTI